MADGFRRCAGWLGSLVALWVLPAVISCSGGVPPDDASPTSTAALVPVQSGLHRLNTVEYNATVRDVLGTTLQPASASWRGGEIAGFDNIASQLGVDEAQYDRYFRAAQLLAADVMAGGDLRARLISCDLGKAECLETSLRGVGLRLFRRPLQPVELESYRRVNDAALALGDDAASAFGLALQAMLASPQFLYRVERDPGPNREAVHSLDGYELASRLSYFLWSSAPDDALLQAAADGSLLKAGGLTAAVDRLLDEGDDLPPDGMKSWRFVASFAGQWLGQRQVSSHASPAWSSREAAAAAQEMLLFFDEFLRTERSWLEFPTADFNYVNGELPFLYDMPVPDVFGAPAPDDWMSTELFRRVEYVDDQRAGFFGLAGFLALTSFDRRTSPSKRGKWIAGNLLCAEPPPPAQALPMLETDAADEVGLSTLDVRQRLEEHRNNPACSSCHALFDPYGLALEQFDPIGRYRETYPDGSPIDASVDLPSQIAADPRFPSCLASKLFTYGLGRVPTESDTVALQNIRDSWLGSGREPSLRRLIHALASSEAFRFRRGSR